MRNELPPIRKYIDPMSDFGFKKIFRDSGKKQFMIRPLNEIFGLDIADIEFRESERQGDTPDNRNACFDLFCTSVDGKRFIVEVQRFRQEHFLERALYYATFPIAESAQKGAWDFDFPPVFVLGLLDFDFREMNGQQESHPGQFIHRFSLRDEQTGEWMTDRLRFAFLEIRRFNKAREQCTNFEEQFLYVMKNLPTFAKEPALWEDPYFRTLLEEAEFAQMSGLQKEQYRQEMRRDWDYKNTMDYAIAQGHTRGLAEGEAMGVAKGKADEQQLIARRMLGKDMPVETIAELTELTEDQIRELAESDILHYAPSSKSSSASGSTPSK